MLLLMTPQCSDSQTTFKPILQAVGVSFVWGLLATLKDRVNTGRNNYLYLMQEH